MKFSLLASSLALLTGLASAIPAEISERADLEARAAAHTFTLINKCSYAVTPRVADTRCGYSPRCADASSFTAGQPATIPAGGRTTVSIPGSWVGRIFVQNGKCGAKGEYCSMGEFNLDTGDQWTPQAYDISNIQGFTQSMQIVGQGCVAATCTNVKCSCTNAYPPGDLSGCGADRPVKGCSAGAVPFTITYCP